MIHPDSRTLVWIEKVAKENNVKDIALAEKPSSIGMKSRNYTNINGLLMEH